MREEEAKEILFELNDGQKLSMSKSKYTMARKSERKSDRSLKKYSLMISWKTSRW